MSEKRSKSECVIQFRSGKMILQNGMVAPDTRMGFLSFFKESNGEVRMTWMSGRDEEEYKLPSGQVKFSRVEKCTTGRVLLFEFTNDKPPLFFWIQEKSTENDAEYISTIQSLIAQARPLTESSRTDIGVVFRDILRSMQSGKKKDINLVDIFGSTTLLSALQEDPAFYMCKLHPFLPEGTDPTGDIVEQVKNPQVAAAAASLGSALRDPDAFRQLCLSFGIDAKTPGVMGFLEGLMKQYGK
ncbi:hypothetical protein DQ04_00491230 [Trypanosoma grayi]|uniref:hypothetical protein n=1 Tax=Trypanosoma grayi TaxID=71804 RepID=UPI0004F46E9E|nr:hypothetical protein DQ04_00491230 [Trypanosoma grayi]KEG14403.1 hypothetical protein DQ04_00491230 [Trypanosoma grayi]